MPSDARSLLLLRRAQNKQADAAVAGQSTIVAEATLAADWDQDDAPGWDSGGFPGSQFHYENLTGVPREQLMQVLTLLEKKNGLARAIINLITGFVVGGDIRFKAESVKAQRVLDKFWYSPYNQMDRNMFMYVKEWRLYGELFWPVIVNPIDGFVHLRYEVPARIRNVRTNPDNRTELTHVILYPKDGIGNGPAFRIMHPASYLEPNSTTEEVVGDCFFIRANALSADPRGYSDLLTMADWFDAVDDLAFSGVERAAQVLGWRKHVKIGGTNTIDAKLRRDLTRELANNKPGSHILTTDNIEIEDIVPNLAAAETAAETRNIISMLSGSSSIPAGWLGFGELNDRVTLDKIGGPTMKMLDRIRRELKYHLQDVAKYVLHQAVMREEIGASTDLSFEIELPAIAEEDYRDWARAAAQLASAAMLLHRNEFITIETASRVAYAALSKIGITFDPETEVEKRRKEPPTLEAQKTSKGGDPAKAEKAGAAQSKEAPASVNSQ